jgi:hypothetical protein
MAESSSLPPITLHKETVEISSGRKLYNYTFEIDGVPARPMTAEDVVPALAPETPAVQKRTDG